MASEQVIDQERTDKLHMSARTKKGKERQLPVELRAFFEHVLPVDALSIDPPRIPDGSLLPFSPLRG
jgi:hypothetical protein